jgi:fructoselysine-6-P-deglycase FrlB-like protein/sugar/nucleoside kinase (ribokinase family)
MDQRQEAHEHGLPTIPPRVVVVGNLTIDDVVLPDGTARMASVGGNSLYTALGARPWQPRVGIVTRRGEDFPRDLASELGALGIAADGVVAIPGPTVRNWVIYEESGDRHWLYRTPRERSREVAVQPGDLPAGWLAADPPPVVHVAAMPLEAAEAIVEAVRRQSPQAVITLDTHEDYVADYRQRLRALAARVDAFLPSRSELTDLVGYDDPRRALSELAGLPTPIIVVKMGPGGALVWDKRRGTLHQVDVAPGPVVDVTGAGDAFCGGLAAALSLDCTALEATQRGVLSAAYAVAGVGSLSLARIEPSEIRARIEAAPPVAHPLPAPVPASEVEVAGADRGISSAADIMREEIAMIPRLLAEQLEALAEPAWELARSLALGGVEHLYMTGCGDSAFAGGAAALAYQKHAEIDAEGVHALHLARYRVRYLPQRSAVVCISFSGKVGRTIEAAAQARRFGHRVIALTGAPDSPLAQQATDILQLSVPTLGYSPGTSTYLALVLALLQLALAWGEERGRAVAAARDALQRLPDMAVVALEAADEPARVVAERFARQPWVTFLAGGPNLATAHFGAAKLVEGPQLLGVATNVEEWAHAQYFVSGKGTPVVLIAPSGASYDRACEILAELDYIGADTAFIGDARPTVAPRAWIPLPVAVPEEFSPVLAALPLSVLAFHMTRARGQERFEFPSLDAAREHYETIHRATLGEPA